MTSLETLTQTAKFLRNAAPREFEQFRVAFDAYANETVSNLINATVNLERAQGMAQQCIKLTTMLEKTK